MKTYWVWTAGALALGLGVECRAAGEMKTGLWEMSIVLSPEQLAAMPKDVKPPGLVGNAIRKQVCITPREAEGLGMLDDRDGGSCKLVNRVSKGNTHSADVVCTDPHNHGGGRWTTVFKDSGNMTAVVEVQVVLADKTVAHRHESSGRWLQADCGQVK